MQPSGSDARSESPVPPGLRTLRSSRFRLLLAAMLAAFGLALNAFYILQTLHPELGWVGDFVPYLQASELMLAGESPYSAALLGGPVDADCPGCYLYPPFLAQVISPLTSVSVETGKVAWFALLSMTMFLAVWLATGIGGARRTPERALWCVAAVTFFLPAFHSNWLGNVSSLVALSVVLVAMGGTAAGLGAAAATLIKVVPAALIPAAFVADVRSRRALVLGLVLVGSASLLLAPGAWLEYPTVLRNMLAGSADVDWNLAPTTLAARSDLPAVTTALVRVITIVLGVICVVGSVWLARRRGGMPAAALLGAVAMLVVPGTLWYHYLAVLLPIAAMAWVRAGAATRIVLLSSAALITAAGVSLLPLALVGSAGLLIAAGYSLTSGLGASDLQRDDRVVESSGVADD